MLGSNSTCLRSIRRKADGCPCLMATAQKRGGRGCEPCQGFLVLALALVVLTQLACAEGRAPAANLVRSARPRQLLAGVLSADGWMQGRASYFGPPASYNDTFVERSVRVLLWSESNSVYYAACSLITPSSHRASDLQARGLLLLHIVALLYMHWPGTHHDMTCKCDIIRPAITFPGIAMVLQVLDSLFVLQSIQTCP